MTLGAAVCCAVDAANVGGPARNRRMKAVTALSVAAALSLAAVPAAATATDNAVVGERGGSLTFRTSTPSIPVSSASGLAWQVKSEVTGADVDAGIVSGSSVQPSLPGPGLYSLSVGGTSADFVVVGETPSYDPFYGVQTHHAFPASFSSWSSPETTLPDLQALGFSSIRDEVYWDHTETAPGVYALRAQDRAYQEKAAELGLDRVFTADFGNGTLGINRPPATPEEQRAFADYAVWVIQNTGVDKVELWNEFNHGQFNNGCKTGACYVAQFGPVADMIHAAAPGVQVIGGATSNVPRDWWTDFYAAGGLDRFDAISYHPYTLPTLADYVTIPAELREEQRSYLPAGVDPKPIVVTEVGWSTAPVESGGNPAKAIAEAVQAERLTYTYLMQAGAPGVQATYWYDAVDDGTDPLSTEHTFGVYRAPTAEVPAFQPKLSALAMWTLRSQLDGYQQAALDLVDGVWRATYTNAQGATKAVLFVDIPQGPVTMADSRAQLVALSGLVPDGAAVSGVDIYGTPSDITGGMIRVSSKPIILTLTGEETTPTPTPVPDAGQAPAGGGAGGAVPQAHAGGTITAPGAGTAAAGLPWMAGLLLAGGTALLARRGTRVRT